MIKPKRARGDTWLIGAWVDITSLLAVLIVDGLVFREM